MQESTQRPFLWLFATLAVVGLVADQASKYVVFSKLYPAEAEWETKVEVIPGYFELRTAYTGRIYLAGSIITDFLLKNNWAPRVGAIYDVNGNYYFPIQGEQFSQRLPDFFQLDVRIDKRFVFQDWMLALYVDVQNATNRQNVEAVLNAYDYSAQTSVTGLPILPVLGVRGEF